MIGRGDVVAASADVIVVGAGIAGLCAARELTGAGRSVLIVEKSRGVGGRMGTRRVGRAVCDHGAQFFTIRGRAFGAIAAAAHSAGRAAVWCDGFHRAGRLGETVVAAADGHSRWRGTTGMTDLPKWLAGEATATTIRTGTRAIAAERRGEQVVLSIEHDGVVDTLASAALVVTAPVPQALELFSAGGLAAEADPQALASLETVAYDPCFALLLELRSASLVPPPGAIQFAAGPVSWIADNFQKGISPVPSLTVHASGAWSRERVDEPPDRVADELAEFVRPWVDGDAAAIVSRSLKLWKFALPTTVLPTPLVAVSAAPPVVCCGDAFAGPKVEGAASSGMAAARWLLRALAAG